MARDIPAPAEGLASPAGGDASRPEQRAERPSRNSERGARGERGRGAERTDSGEHVAQSGGSTERGQAAGDGRAERPRDGQDGRDAREGRNERRPERRPRQERQDQNAAAEVSGGEPMATNAPSVQSPTPVGQSSEGANQVSAMADDQPALRSEVGEAREKRSRDRFGRERGPRTERTGRGPAEDRQERQPRDPQQALEGFAALVAPALNTAGKPEPAASVAGINGSDAPATTTLTADLPKVQPFVLPVDDLAQVAQNCGLSWINSDGDKINAAQAAIAAQPKAIHIPRQRPAAPVIDEAPLVLVETKRDLRAMTLPFEQSAN